MHFRVTSVANEDVGSRMNHVLVTLEDWLNASLGDGMFGGSLDRLMIVVFSGDFIHDVPRGRGLTKSRLSTYNDSSAKATTQVLALHVEVEPNEVLNVPSSEMLRLVSKAISLRLPEKPLRAPKHLDYVRLRQALVASLAVYARSEA